MLCRSVGEAAVAPRKPTELEIRVRAAQARGATRGFQDDFPTDALTTIVREKFPKMGKGKIARLLVATDDAVTQLAWDRGQQEKAATAARHSDLSNSVLPLVENLSSALRDGSIDGLLALEHPERAHRIRHEVVPDLLWLRSMLAATSDAGRTRKDFEYRCAVRIAAAWLRATGKAPTMTRNTDAPSGKQAMAFQKYVAKAVKPEIGAGILRAAIADFGANKRRKRRAESPKGKRGH
jgi:hypothetical protein